MISKENNDITIPDYQTIMLPFLKFLSDKKEHKVREIINHISDKFNLTDEERKELLPSGQQPIIDNRVGWARTYIKKAGLIEAPKKGYVKISDRGIEVLQQNPDKIDIKFLNQFPEFVAFRTQKGKTVKNTKKGDSGIDEKTPTELMEIGNKKINDSLAQDLLEKLRNEIDPYFFEEVVGKLLTAMGYGKSKVTKRSNDGGVDGFVNQDKLGLDKIIFQAKKYDENNTVTATQVRDFVGTLDIHGVNKGIFITTSKFPQKTDQIIGKTTKTIILIQGTELAELMIEYDVGVTTEKTYKIKKIDEDFFIE